MFSGCNWQISAEHLRNTVSLSLLLGDDSSWIKTALRNCKQLFVPHYTQCLQMVLCFSVVPCFRLHRELPGFWCGLFFLSFQGWNEGNNPEGWKGRDGNYFLSLERNLIVTLFFFLDFQTLPPVFLRNINKGATDIWFRKKKLFITCCSEGEFYLILVLFRAAEKSTEKDCHVDGYCLNSQAKEFM